MDETITQLFPATVQDVVLKGLYLEHALHSRGRDDHPFVYTNFITSLDGRIAITGEDRSTHQVPLSITNLRDWRLYQELAGQADILVTSGRYFRQSEAGEAQDILPVGNQPDYADIREWRQAQGLRSQPDIAIMSGSLDIPLETLEPYRQRRIIVVTGSEADPARVQRLEKAGIRLMIAGDDRRVDGRQMIDQLASAGYRSIYAIAGPEVFHTLLAGGTIDRLYLTLACQLLGGSDYDTLLE
ncbi:MAG: dihydrofolate reductase family protein, partial [Thiohalobacterales bacterium]|nr:dihydrofolate reductase family protein [Thiohalobacterales bacterium]